MANYNIKPCDTSKPYVLISYSSDDTDVVYRDVEHLQQLGYNVFTDKYLDKTRSGWHEDVLEKIQDHRCKMVLFYLSETSIISEPCRKEMDKVRDEDTEVLHGEEVPLIVIEAQDITGKKSGFRLFIDRVKDRIRESDYSVQNKTTKIKELDAFVEKYLDNGNKSVVKYFGNRDEYHDEIKNYFKSIRYQLELKNIGPYEIEIDNSKVEENEGILVQTASFPVQETVAQNQSKVVSANNSTQLFYMTNRGSDARGRYMPNGKDFLVLKGSRIASEPNNSCPEGALKAREQHASKIVNNQLTEDIRFKSQSGAAAFVSGSSINGKDAWKETSGNSSQPTAKVSVSTASTIYFMSNRGSNARGCYKADGKGFVVLKGSRIAADTTESYQKHYANLRPKFSAHLSGLEVIKDIEFTSISTAASFVAGHGMNGKDTWKIIRNEFDWNTIWDTVVKDNVGLVDKWELIRKADNNWMKPNSNKFKREHFGHHIEWKAPKQNINAMFWVESRKGLSELSDKMEGILQQLKVELPSIGFDSDVKYRDTQEGPNGFVIVADKLHRQSEPKEIAEFLVKATDILLSVVSEYC